MRRGLTPQGWLETSNGKVHYQSGYEKRFMIWLDEHHVKWEKCKERFPYVGADGKKHSYNPDFLVHLDKTYYVEVKGAIRKNDPFKFRCFPLSLPLVLLGYDELHNKLGLNVFNPEPDPKKIDRSKWPYKLLSTMPDYVELGTLDDELKAKIDSSMFMQELMKYI